MTSTTAPAHRRRIPKRTAAIAAIVLGASAISLTLASPASADPIGKYVAVGSDTTQDVMDGLANQLGGGYVGSYDAFDPVTGFVRNPADGLASDTAQAIKVKASANLIARPNGSGDGLNALRGARGTAASAGAPYNSGVSANSIDIARSSSGPGTATGANGTVQYIPFALDAVTIAVGPTTSIASHALFTKADLVNLYVNCNPVVEGGVTYNPGSGGNIHLYLPQSGSGTAKFFYTTALGGNEGTPAACVSRTEVAGAHVGKAVEEHDGSVLADDPAGIAPFSIAQWIAQSKAIDATPTPGTLPVHDRRHGAVIQPIDGINPTTTAGPPPSGNLNVNFSASFKREVYNVVTRAELASETALSALLVSTDSTHLSSLCSQTFTITSYGFASLATQPFHHFCGEADDGTANGGTTLRAFDPATTAF